MDRLTKIRVHRVDETHKVDEYQETLYTYTVTKRTVW